MIDVEIYWDDGGQLTPAQLKMLTQVINATVKYGSVPDGCEVSISFMDSDEIHVLNRDYRGKDAPTDVLSFPVNDTLAMSAGRPLGDIVVCMEAAQRQARDYGHSLERELAFLIVHGMLHLLGYDHETPEDEAAMFTAQDEILNLLHIIR